MNPIYLHLLPDGALPAQPTIASPFRAIVIIEAPVTPAWRASVSEWLVRKGCLIMLA